MDTKKMTLEELKNYYSKLKETMDNRYKSYYFFVNDDLDVFVSEMCSECGGMKGPASADELANPINADVLSMFDTITALGEALGIELLIATKTFDCECGMFYCENCGNTYEMDELFKVITVDEEKIFFCCEDCYEEWQEDNE